MGADIRESAAGFDADYAENTPINADGTADYTRRSVRDGGGLFMLRLFRCLKPIVAVALASELQ
jgi:hypothetical protein